MPSVHLELSSHPATATSDGGTRTPLATRDALLLAWLALEGPCARSRVAALLWPASDAESARNALRQRLFQLKRQWGGLVIGGTTLALGDDVTHDLGTSDRLLDGLLVADATELADWLARERDRRWRLAIGALEAQAQGLEEAGDYLAALRTAAELIDRDPLAEVAHRRLMRLHYLRGDRAAALLAFDRCEQLLKDEIGARPSAETLDLLATLERATPLAHERARPALPASVLRPPRLVGRERELAALHQAWDDDQVAVVVGEAGLGKTRLLQAFAAQRGDGVVVASARPGDAGVPFATLARLLRDLVHCVPAALHEAPRHEIARLLPEFGDAVVRQSEGQRLLLERAVSALLGAAGEQLRGIVVDDLQFADAASVEMLQATLTGDARPGLGWVLAMRPADAGSVVQGLIDALLDQGRLAPIGLPALDADALVALVRSLDLPQFDADALAPALMQLTGGNPMFVLETLKRLWALPAHGQGAALPRPGNVGMLIDRRLAQLSAPALTLARVAAIAGTDFGIALTEAVIGQPALQLASAWHELEAAQVLRDGAFAHDLVYEAALRSVPPHIARHTHAAVAEWLNAHDGEPARIAEHWLQAGDSRRAVPHLIDAGWRSSHRTRLAEARGFFERAVAAAAGCGARTHEFEALEALHENYSREDPGPAHDAVVQRLHDLAQTDEERLRASLATHNLRRRRSQPPDLGALGRDVVLAERLNLRDLLRSLVTMQVGGLCSAGDPRGARAILDRHQALFDDAGDAEQLADFHGNLGVAFANLDEYAPALDHTRRCFELSSRFGHADEAITTMSNELRVLRTQGRLERALARLEQLDRWHASDAPNPRSWLISRAGASEMLRDAGRFSEALRVLQVEPGTLRRHTGDVWPAWPVAEAGLWLALGQHSRARQALQAIDDDMLRRAPDWLQARVRLTQAQVGARALGHGVADRPGAREWAWLDQASALAPRDRRRSTWIECELQRAAWVEPALGAALAESLAAVAAQHDMRGYTQAALLCALRHRLEAGVPAAVRPLATAVRAAAEHRFADGEAPEPVYPNSWSLMQRDHVLARALSLDDEAAGQRALQAAARALRRRAAEQVPEAFRDGFLHRHPVHVALLADAAAG